jgi:hypothetical protein
LAAMSDASGPTGDACLASSITDSGHRGSLSKDEPEVTEPTAASRKVSGRFAVAS